MPMKRTRSVPSMIAAVRKSSWNIKSAHYAPTAVNWRCWLGY